MKYNEAIDMILDGGRAKRNFWLGKSKWLSFKKNCQGALFYADDAYYIVYDNDIIATDWIVEKDGVVYEEPPNKIRISEKFTIPKDFADEIARRMIDDKIIADEVNEEWLEKKILCVTRKQASQVIKHADVMGTCFNANCPFCFCFPEKPEREIQSAPVRGNIPLEDIERAVKAVKAKKCPKCNENMYECNALPAGKPAAVVYRCAKCDDGEWRGKVTVGEMMKLIQNYCYEFYHDCEAENYLLNRKLEYLVSLQEK